MESFIDSEDYGFLAKAIIIRLVLNLIVPLIAGILLGFFLRDKKRLNLSKVVFVAILALIFSMGFTIGSNNDLLASMPKIGLNALVIVLFAVFFSTNIAKICIFEALFKFIVET